MRNIFKNNLRQFERRERNEEKKISKVDLSLEHFPVLVNPTFQQKNLDGFLDKIKTEKIKNETKIDNFKNVQPGWVLIKRDKKTGTISMKRGQETTKKNNILYENDHSFNVLKGLSDLHEKRTNEYIEMWGYDEWERMFISPNHDYNYFDRLNEEEEEKQRELEEKEYEENNDYTTDKKFDKYWEQY